MTESLAAVLALAGTGAAALAQGDVAAARRTLAEVRGHWHSLDESDQAALLPVARHLAEQLAALDDVASTPSTPAPSPPPTRTADTEPQDPDALLAQFGYSHWRPGQRDAVSAALAGRDALVVMPTGGGKTLCYQLPALARPELTIVVSPLVALITDQWHRLREGGHPVVMLAADHDNRSSLDEIRSGAARVAYVAPERFASRAFMDAIETRRVGLFVVDEAHCIAEWGHDFRPDYLRLRQALENVGRPPVMACTATATPPVADEIAARLGLVHPLIVRSGFDRPNLTFDVIHLEGKGSMERKRGLLHQGLSREDTRPAIVYCGTRSDVERVTDDLCAAGIAAVGYHAGLASEARTRAQREFMDGRADVVVATNAFGMGIDKADVRSVWHWALPTSLEAYYQEAGRAGRDGAPARAVLLALRADLGKLLWANRQHALTVPQVEQTLAQIHARAAGTASVSLQTPLDDDLRLSLSVAEQAGAIALAPGTGGTVEVVLRGPLDRAAASRACRGATDRRWQAFRAIERFSVDDGNCRRRTILKHFGDLSEPAPEVRCCSACAPIDWLDLTSRLPKKRGATPRAASNGDAPLKADDLIGPLAEMLKAWRRERAGSNPAYTVCSNVTLAAILEHRPASEAELATIRGIGPRFLENHAPSLLELLARASSPP